MIHMCNERARRLLAEARGTFAAGVTYVDANSAIAKRLIFLGFNGGSGEGKSLFTG